MGVKPWEWLTLPAGDFWWYWAVLWYRVRANLTRGPKVEVTE